LIVIRVETGNRVLVKDINLQLLAPLVKAVNLTIVLMCFSGLLWGQEIELTGTYAASTSIKFQHNFGGGVGYNHFLTHRSRLGFFIGYSINTTPYHDSFTSTTDLVRFFNDVQPTNQRVALKINYAFNLLKSSKSMLFIGAEVGLSHFIITEKGEQVVISRLGTTSSVNFSSTDYVCGRIGLGLLIEYELKDIICKRISPSFSIHPEVTSYAYFGLKGSSDPTFIGWLNFNVGIKYSLAKNR